MMLFGPGDGMVLYEKAKGLAVVVVDFAENTTVKTAEYEGISPRLD